jgi:hypothetical protein
MPKRPNFHYVGCTTKDNKSSYDSHHLQRQNKSIVRLNQIYSEIPCTVQVSDKRCKDSWISAFVEDVGAAIANYQASNIQKLTPMFPGHHQCVDYFFYLLMLYLPFFAE